MDTSPTSGSCRFRWRPSKYLGPAGMFLHRATGPVRRPNLRFATSAVGDSRLNEVRMCSLRAEPTWGFHNLPMLILAFPVWNAQRVGMSTWSSDVPREAFGSRGRQTSRDNSVPADATSVSPWAVIPLAALGKAPPGSAHSEAEVPYEQNAMPVPDWSDDHAFLRFSKTTPTSHQHRRFSDTNSPLVTPLLCGPANSPAG